MIDRSLLFFPLMFFLALSCSLFQQDNTKIENEANISGTVLYYIDTLDWIGCEGDPSGFILDHYTWSNGEPDYECARVYLSGNIDSTYLNNDVIIVGDLDSITGGGTVTPLRTFPMIDVKNIGIGT